MYRVSPKNQNLLDGKNQYILTLIYADGRASETETLTVYYIKDPLARKNIEQDINQTYLAKLNSPEEVAKRQLSVQKEKEKAEQLDPRYYYDANYKPFEMKLFVMNEPRQNEVYAEKIKANLMSLGIKTNIEVVNQKMLSEQFDKGEKNYDMILIGFETSPKRTQLSQLFDSNRAAKGVNFSKIKNKPLDDLFLKYKLAVDTAAYDTLEQNMLSIFQKESVLLPIASPLTHIDIDRNLKGIQNFPVF